MVPSSTIGQILRKTRCDHKLTLAQVSDILGVSNQRVSQWEGGADIPLERIREWASDDRLPDWARVMVHQMWLAAVQQDQARIGSQIADLQKQLTLLLSA